MKILVTGVSGQLGFDVCRELQRRHIAFQGVSSGDFDLTVPERVRSFVLSCSPDAVIHCAAYTAVDRAEEEQQLCWAVNAEGTRVLAECCYALQAKLLYVSTDYVFSGDGDRFYETDAPTGPKNFYGRSKLAGEQAIQEYLKRFFIVRGSWMFGQNGKNFVHAMLRLSETNANLRVVCDQTGSPTYTADLAPLLCDMIMTEKYGIYHAANEGICSWAEFAREIFRIAGRRTAVIPIASNQYPTRAVRPLNSRLSRKSLDAAGFARLPTWQDALRRFLAK